MPLLHFKVEIIIGIGLLKKAKGIHPALSEAEGLKSLLL